MLRWVSVTAMPTPPLNVLAHVHQSRLAPYRACAGASAGDHELLALYNWNIHLTAAWQEVLGVVEIALRNAIDQQLRVWNQAQNGSAKWLRKPAPPLDTFFLSSTRHNLNDLAHKARARRSSTHPRKQAPISHDDLLAQVMFGSWAYLLPQKHEPNAAIRSKRRKLWDEALVNAFPNLKLDNYGHGVGARVGRLHKLRNRVSHMENLLSVDVEERRRDALQLINAISPDVHDWLHASNRLMSVAALRPFP